MGDVDVRRCGGGLGFGWRSSALREASRDAHTVATIPYIKAGNWPDAYQSFVYHFQGAIQAKYSL